MYYPRIHPITIAVETMPGSLGYEAISVIAPDNMTQRVPGSKCLTRKLYHFTLVESVIVLRSYREQERKTYRHVWTDTAIWHKDNRQHGIIDTAYRRNSVERPTLSADVRLRVVEGFMYQIRLDNADEIAGKQR